MYENFTKILSKYIDLNNYKLIFKNRRGENEMWLYRKNGSMRYKRVVVGYQNEDGVIYKNKKDFVGKKMYRLAEMRKYQQGLVITKDTLENEDYLKDYLTCI